MKPGIYPNFDPVEYHELNNGVGKGSTDWIVSRSDLAGVLRCPQEWLLKDDIKDTRSLRIGSLVDTLVLQPETFKRLYAVQPENYSNAPDPRDVAFTENYPGAWNGRTKACRLWKEEMEGSGLEVMSKSDFLEKSKPRPWNNNSDTCKAWVAGRKREGKTVVTRQEKSDADAMAEQLLAHRVKDWGGVTCGEFVGHCDKQVLAIAEYTEPTTGLKVKLRALLDMVPNNPAWKDSAWDLKTSRDVTPDGWRRSVAFGHYDLQAAFYLWVYNLAKPASHALTTFGHLCVCNEEPFMPMVSYLSSDYLEIGRNKFDEAVRVYCQCLKDGSFPGFNGGEMLCCEPKPWELQQWMKKDVA